MTQFGAVP